MNSHRAIPNHELTCSLHRRLVSRSQWVTARGQGGDYIQGSDAGWWEKFKFIGIRASSDVRRRLVKKVIVHNRKPVKLYMAAPSRNGIPSHVIWGHGEVPSMGQVVDHPSGPSKRTTKAEYHHDPGPTAGWSASVFAGCKGRLAGYWKDPSLSPGRPLGRLEMSPSRRSLAGPRVGCVRMWNEVLMVEP